jgi:dihydrofolate synthase/folylpolyglutamate synthase
MGYFSCTHAVFGAMADKDIDGIFKLMAPLVDCWHFTDLEIARAAGAAQLQQQFLALLSKQALKAPAGVQLESHADPLSALKAAAAHAAPTDRILVFGSFHTVGGVLEDGVPRLMAAPPA